MLTSSCDSTTHIVVSTAAQSDIRPPNPFPFGSKPPPSRCLDSTPMSLRRPDQSAKGS